MDETLKRAKIDRISKSLEKLLTFENKDSRYYGKNKEYFITISESFTDIESEKYNVLLFSCACYILYNMNIDKPNFIFDKKIFLSILEDLYPLFNKTFDRIQIQYGIFRYICFILSYKNININSVLV